jgi:hypothetical protein
MKFRLMQIAMVLAVLAADYGMHIDGAKWS